MDEQTKQLDLAQFEEYAKRRWRWEPYDADWPYPIDGEIYDENDTIVADGVDSRDGQFIAVAPQLVNELIAARKQITALKAENARLLKVIQMLYRPKSGRYKLNPDTSITEGGGVIYEGEGIDLSKGDAEIVATLMNMGYDREYFQIESALDAIRAALSDGATG